MGCYNIPDLLKLLRNERGESIKLDVGLPPTLVVKGELYEVEGPEIVEESMEEMLRTVASTRDMRTFRASGSVDIIVPFQESRFLVRAVRAFGICRLGLFVSR